jgi:hypothetical protein
VGIAKYADISVLAIPTPRGYVKMTEEELQEKIDHAKREADLAFEKWLYTDHNTGVIEKDVRLGQIDHEIWISSIRRYNALKSNYQRWRVNKTGHKQDE